MLLEKDQNHNGFFSIDEIQIEYRYVKASQSSDLTMILLHEGLGCTALWKNAPEEISKAYACDVFVYSRLGYGKSSPVAQQRSIDYMHVEANQYLPKVLHFLQPKKYVLLGHSDGGSIATIFAGSEQAENLKDNLQGIILLAPHFFVEDVSVESIRLAGEQYKAGQLRQQLAFYHGQNVDQTFYGWHDAWLLEPFRDWQIKACLAAVQVPILGLQGTNDAYGTALQLESILELRPKLGTIHFLADCGHNVFRDDMVTSLAHITSFLNKHNIA